MAWLLLKDTVNSCIEYRILGLAAEAAFFTLLSLPPLLLGLIGLLGYVDDWTNTTTVASIERNILAAAGTVLSQRGSTRSPDPCSRTSRTAGGPMSSRSVSRSRSGPAPGRSMSSSTPSR